MIKDKPTFDIDWEIREEQNPLVRISKELNLTPNLRSLYGVKSITKFQNSGRRLKYTTVCKDYNNRSWKFVWKCQLGLKCEIKLKDLENDFLNKCQQNSIDRVTSLMIWECLERDLFIYYEREADKYSHEAIKQFVIDHPEYAHGNALNIVQKEFDDKYSLICVCIVCGARGGKRLLVKHMIEEHTDYLQQCSVEPSSFTNSTQLPKPNLLAQDEILEGKWVTVKDVLNNKDGILVGVVGKVHESIQYAFNAFLFCNRCFYSGIDNVVFHKIFRIPVSMNMFIDTYHIRIPVHDA